MRLALSLTVLAMIGFGSVAEACRCVPPPAPEKALEKASAVFSGKVTKIEKAGPNVRVTIAVEQSWKGPLEKELVVVTSASSAACGFTFAEKKSYLVYCTGGKGLRTNLCTRTKPLAGAKEDLKALGDGQAPPEEE